MKTYLLLILSLISFSAFAQPGSLSQSVYRSRVNDSTTVNGATASGYGYFFWNNQKTTPSWQFWDGTSLVDWNPGVLPEGNLPAKYIFDIATPSTAGGTITLDMNSQMQRIFVGSASFATAKDIAMSNATNALVFNFHFEITNTAATVTLPTGWLMSDALFASNVWTPVTTGLYELGGSFDGTNWKIKIMGPFN